jgi:hypothetical protein
MLVEEIELIIKNNGFDQLQSGNTSVIPNIVDLVVEYGIANGQFELLLSEEEKGTLKAEVSSIVFGKEYNSMSSIPEEHLTKMLAASSLTLIGKASTPEPEPDIIVVVEPGADPDPM